MNSIQKKNTYIVSVLKDNTVYDKYDSSNYGLLPNIFLTKNLYVSNILMKFKQDLLPGSILTGSESAILRIYNQPSCSLSNYNYNIDIYTLNTYWLMGIGDQNITENTLVSNWNYCTNDTSSNWNGGISNIDTSSKISYEYKYLNISNYPDISINITNIVNNWITDSSSNNGILITIPTSGSFNINYYSKETNTIYEPNLLILRDLYINFSPSTEQELITFNSNLYSSSLSNVYLYMNNVKKSYFKNTVNRINVMVYEKNFRRSFKNNNENKILTNLYYQVLDLISSKIVIPFSLKTKVKYDIDQNYFILNTSNFITNRSYKISFKILELELIIINSSQSFRVI